MRFKSLIVVACLAFPSFASASETVNAAPVGATVAKERPRPLMSKAAKRKALHAAHWRARTTRVRVPAHGRFGRTAGFVPGCGQ